MEVDDLHEEYKDEREQLSKNITKKNKDSSR